jgi:uncharacterized protein YndB with AHSA1/START domain
MTVSDNKTTIIAEPGTQNVVTTRVIKAPRNRVYQAYVDPELFVQWIGPRELTMKLVEMNPTPGGRYRYINTDAEGNEYAFRGVFHDLKENESIVQTFEFEGMPGHVCLESLRLEDVDGGTLITGTSVFQSVADRDGMVQSGMEIGVDEGYQKLEELLSGS